jgi:hypothetical protein
MMLPQNMNPKFLQWVSGQPESVRTSVEAKWAELQAAPFSHISSMPHDHRDRARRAALLAWCAEAHRYEVI